MRVVASNHNPSSYPAVPDLHISNVQPSRARNGQTLRGSSGPAGEVRASCVLYLSKNDLLKESNKHSLVDLISKIRLAREGSFKTEKSA